jgi:trk system potassium uptake protein TrkH
VKQTLIPRLLLLLLGLIAAAMLPSLLLAAVYGEEEMSRSFGIVLGPALAMGLGAALSFRKEEIRFRVGEGFLLVFLAWVCACLLGALPYYLSGRIPRFSNAVFESASGFTTTGATVIANTESQPRSLLFWRATTHWLGGMGVVILSAAILPLLGAGGSQLMRNESAGPDKDTRISPKITAAAKILWLLYVVLTAVQTVLLLLGGMNWFDALIHSFSTLATGGFSSRNNSIAAFDSPWIDWVTIIFMLLAGCNFTLIPGMLRGKFREVFQNSEIRAYGLIILLSVTIITLSLLSHQDLREPRPEALTLSGPAAAERCIRQAFFHTASILSTTGFSVTNHNEWPVIAQGVLFFLLFIGGCSGSTAGGIKVVRHVVLFKQTGNEMKRLLYPRGIFNIRLNNQVGRKDVVYGVAGFVFLYLVLAGAAALLLSGAGVEPFSAINGGLLMVGNVGLGLEQFGPGSALPGDLPGYTKWGLSFVMIAGRLELWTAIVFFSREYWRH